MSVVYITSDWHLGHKNITRFRTEFGTIGEHEGLIIENYHSTVKSRDKVFFLGDMCFNKESLEIIRTLPGSKHLVLGNHDTDAACRPGIAELSLVYDKIHGIHSYKHAWLTHAPIHPQELRDKWNIHGHVHSIENSIKDPNYFNACLENTEYKPIAYQEILRIMRSRNEQQTT